MWPDNAAAIDAFLSAASQWRTSIELAEGRLRPVFVGLDYAGAAVAWAARGIAMTPATWSGFVQLEQAARAALNGEAP